jgi:malate dehydrogenase (quinone)
MKKWEGKIKEMIPSYGQKLLDNPELFRKVQDSTDEILGLGKENIEKELQAVQS